MNVKFNRISTIVGVTCKDGIILGAEKLLPSKLMKITSDKRLYNIDRHIGMVFYSSIINLQAIGGKIPDARLVMDRGRGESSQYFRNFDVAIRGSILSNRLASFVH